MQRQKLSARWMAATLAGAVLAITGSAAICEAQVPIPPIPKPGIIPKLNLKGKALERQEEELERQEAIQNQVRKLADDAYQAGQFQQVIQHCEYLLVIDKADYVALHLRASARIELGRARKNSQLIRDGIADARQSLALQGRKFYWLYLPYFYGMTSLSELEKRPEHAQICLQVAGPLFQNEDIPVEDRANLLYQRALAQIAVKNPKAAIADFAESIKLSPKHLGSHTMLARTLVESGEGPAALVQFDAALQAFPTNVPLYNERGVLRRQLGQLDGALEDFSKALELDPRFAMAYTNRGICLIDLNDPIAAESDLSAALKLEPQNAFVLRMRATTRASLGNAAGAIQDDTLALATLGTKATGLDAALLYEERGFAKLYLKDFSGAIADFQKCSQLDAGSAARVRPWLWISFSQLEKFEEAKAPLQQALDEPVSQRGWGYQLCAYLADQQTIEQLLAVAQKTGDAEGGTAVAQQRLCEAHFFAGQKALLAKNADAATEHFRQCLKTKSFHLAAFRGARFQLGEFPK